MQCLDGLAYQGFHRMVQDIPTDRPLDAESNRQKGINEEKRKTTNKQKTFTFRKMFKTLDLQVKDTFLVYEQMVVHCEDLPTPQK